VKITSTKNNEHKRTVLCTYGPSGQGKTYQAKTLERPIILSYESGLSTLADSDLPYIDMTKGDKDQILPPSQRMKKIDQVHDWLLAAEQMKKYRTIFVDSLTEIGELIFEVAESELKEKAKNEGKNYNSMQAYGRLFTDLSRFVKAFRDMPHYDVIFVALDAKTENEDTGISETTLALPGTKSKKQIPGLLDHVFYLEKKFDKACVAQRMFLTTATEKIFAKNRTNSSVTLEKYEEADLGKLINKLKGVK